MKFPWVLLALALLGSASPSSAQPAQTIKQVHAAQAQIGVTLYYDPSYVRLPYPNGDIPLDRGVCSDVVVRVFRAVGVDLQRLIHEDMASNFSAYPKLWGLRAPDSNIDHRRVPNLQRFFERKGKALPVSTQVSDYRPGDVVSWRLPNGLAHIGVVSDRKNGAAGRPLVIHNIGRGAQEEDVLFEWLQTGHYRWFSETPSQ